MTSRIFRSVFLVALVVLLASLCLNFGALYTYFGGVQNGQLRTELALASDGVEASGMDYLQELGDIKCRLTWVAANGDVLFDSQGDVSIMENHAQREEIREAMETGEGESSRYSETLTEQTMYYARRLTDGTVLRVSVSRMTVFSLVMGMLQPICVILAVALVLSAVLASRLSKKIVEPLNNLDLDKPLENTAYDEIAPLLRHIESQHRQIRRQKEELQRRQDEFSAVTYNMNEGLVLLNQDGMILSMNPAAATFFSVAPDCEGRDFLTVERNHEISKTLAEAATEGRAELQITRSGRAYQLNATRIAANGETSGTVLLIFDVTDKVYAEQNRKEFTANISHELKTPLQSIMGSAELMENGLVKPEDEPVFLGRIRSQAARLVALIEDIIRLSQLDEKSAPPMEEVDLFAFAAGEVKNFETIAQAKGVSLTLEGESAMIKGVPQLLHEILYNLCDNAIKYNREGGSVKVAVEPGTEGVVLRVADTGIGIPPEHQTRVFERFYRVDKSHSKETGGTGLGLSIVKHAVQYMGGRIELTSKPGEGTVITILFP